MRRHASLVTILLLLATALLTGCGGAGNGIATKTPDEILIAARAAAQDANSVHLVINTHVGRSALTLDARLAENAAQAKAVLLGIESETIRDGDTVYLKGNPLYDAQLASELGTRIPPGVWIKGTPDDKLGRSGTLTNIHTELAFILSGRGPVTKGKATTIDGQPAIELKQAQQLYTGTLYIATVGKPYPLLLRKTGRETGETTFSGWDEPITVAPPANAIDIAQLEHHT